MLFVPLCQSAHIDSDETRLTFIEEDALRKQSSVTSSAAASGQGGIAIESKIEHILFIFSSFRELVEVLLIDVDMAS